MVRCIGWWNASMAFYRSMRAVACVVCIASQRARARRTGYRVDRSHAQEVILYN